LAFDFEFHGGVVKPTIHTNEKFLLWFIVGGREVPLNHMLKGSMVEAVAASESPHPMPGRRSYLSSGEDYSYGGSSTDYFGRQILMSKFSTHMPYCKLFIQQSGFGVPSRYHSFYLQLMESPYPTVTILPFSIESTGFFFKGKLRFMGKQEVLNLLNDDVPSKKFLRAQGALPIELLKRMVRVDKGDMRKGIRHVRMSKD
jgi:hypothetical protein